MISRFNEARLAEVPHYLSIFPCFVVSCPLGNKSVSSISGKGSLADPLPPSNDYKNPEEKTFFLTRLWLVRTNLIYTFSEGPYRVLWLVVGKREPVFLPRYKNSPRLCPFSDLWICPSYPPRAKPFGVIYVGASARFPKDCLNDRTPPSFLAKQLSSSWLKLIFFSSLVGPLFLRNGPHSTLQLPGRSGSSPTHERCPPLSRRLFTSCGPEDAQGLPLNGRVFLKLRLRDRPPPSSNSSTFFFAPGT